MRNIKKVMNLLTALMFLCVGSVNAQNTIPLWPPDQLPNSKGLSIQDSVQNDRIYMNQYPEMIAFHPPKEENSGTAVLIFPGGGYNHLTYDLGGFQIAKWFNTLGIHAFVVNYRLPKSPDLEQRELAPLQDAQRAMRIVRSSASDYGIDSEKIGVMGTSAGGHLASTISTHMEDHSAIDDSLNQFSFLPNFAVLISPVITFGEFGHSGSKNNLLGDNPSREMIEKFSNELNVIESTPSTFLVHAANDQSVHPMNSILFYRKLIEQGITSSSLHIFPQGAHAIGISGNPGSTQQWKQLCESWLIEIGVLD